jgi:hypothetical protein
MRQWIAELRLLLVTHTWALSLMYDSVPGLDLYEVAKEFEPEMGMVSPKRKQGVLVDVEPYMEAFSRLKREAESPYTADMSYSLLTIGIVAQLADCSARLHLRRRFRDEDVFHVLHHIRNALSHGMTFHFVEKYRPIKTRTAGGVTITDDMHGLPFWRELGPKDIWDILAAVYEAAELLPDADKPDA